MWMVWRIASLAAALPASSVAAAAERELDAHLHGHGTMNIVMEGSVLWIELEAPGADIVGFEHAARSDEDKAAVEDAKARLAEPLGLIALPADAECSLVESEVSLEGLDHQDMESDNDEHAHDDHGEEEHADHDDHAHEEAGEEGHSEFHARYQLNCVNPEKIDEMTFIYFEQFAGAEELVINLIVEGRQDRREVGRDSPVLRIEGR